MLTANYLYQAPDGRMFSSSDILGKFDIFVYKLSFYLFIPKSEGEMPSEPRFVYVKDTKKLYQSGTEDKTDTDPEIKELFSMSDTNNKENLYKINFSKIYQEEKDDICKKLVKIIKL